MYRPLIGITTAVNIDTSTHWRFLRAYEANTHAIEQAGGIPVLVPCTLQPHTLRALYERLDGLLLPGGGDVDPAIYSASPHPQTKYIDRERDDTEMTLARWAVDESLPVFGICRGHQVFNVALGGTLVQDIPSQLKTDLQHDIFAGQPRNLRLHDVAVAPDSLLAKVLSTTQIAVNSLHHQSVEAVAPRLRVTAYAPDGIIEATEIPEHPFALTVQWHPEDMVSDDESMRGLFRAFVQASATAATTSARHA